MSYSTTSECLSVMCTHFNLLIFACMARALSIGSGCKKYETNQLRADYTSLISVLCLKVEEIL